MILCFGEVLFDCLPSENVIGGAPLNVAVHLNRLGANAKIKSRIGVEGLGEELMDFLIEENLSEYVTVTHEYPTGTVTVEFVDNEPKYTIDVPRAWQYIRFAPLEEKPEMVVFGSLATYFSKSQDTLFHYREIYPDVDFFCDLNIRNPFFDDAHAKFCLESADIIKLNEDEEKYLINMFQLHSTADLLALLKDDYSIERVVITRGVEGSEIHWFGKQYNEAIAPVENFQDSIGAGDSFSARFIFGVLNGEAPDLAAKNGAALASKVCETKGAIPDKSSDIYSHVSIQ